MGERDGWTAHGDTTFEPAQESWSGPGTPPAAPYVPPPRPAVDYPYAEVPGSGAPTRRGWVVETDPEPWEPEPEPEPAPPGETVAGWAAGWSSHDTPAPPDPRPRGWPGEADPVVPPGWGTDAEPVRYDQGMTGWAAGTHSAQHDQGDQGTTGWPAAEQLDRPGHEAAGWPTAESLAAPDPLAQGGSGGWPAEQSAGSPDPTSYGWPAGPDPLAHGLPPTSPGAVPPDGEAAPDHLADPSGAGLPGASWEEPESRPAPGERGQAAGGGRRRRRREVRRPAPGEPRGRRGRPKPKGFVKTTLVLVVALGTVLGLYQFQALRRDSSGTAAVVDKVDPAAPFAGSPAESWAAGPAGIKVAEPHQAGSFSAQQVHTALDTAKKLLVAANLDPATLRGEYPAAYVKLLNPLHRAEFEQALKNPRGGTDPTAWVTRFNPAKSQLHGKIVKVQGEITYQAVKTTQLRVHADVMFVYPVRTDTGQGAALTRVVARRIVDLYFYLGRDLPLTVASLGPMRSSFAGAACQGVDGYIEPVLSSTDGGAGGDARDPYDQSAQPDQQQGCGRVRGT